MKTNDTWTMLGLWAEIFVGAGRASMSPMVLKFVGYGSGKMYYRIGIS